MDTRDYNNIMPLNYPRKRRRRKVRTELGRVVAEAEAAGLSYGKYVAQTECYAYVRPRPENRPSARVDPNRTLLDGLNSELTNLESRVEWLKDPVAKAILNKRASDAEYRARICAEIDRRNTATERRVREFCIGTQEMLRKRGRYHG